MLTNRTRKGGTAVALTQCKECGHDVSTTASACPNCGAPDFLPGDVKEDQKKSKPSTSKTLGCLLFIILVIAFIILMVVFIVIYYWSGSNGGSTSNSSIVSASGSCSITRRASSYQSVYIKRKIVSTLAL